MIGRAARVLAHTLRELGIRLVRWRGDRRDAVSFSRDAWESMQQEDWDRAIFRGRVAVAADASYPDGYLMLGYAYLRAGDFSRARGTFERGAHIFPTDSAFYAALGDLSRELAFYAEAEALYRRSLELEPDHPDLLLKLSDALEHQGKLEEAQTRLEQAMVSAPDDLFVLRKLSEVHTHLKEYVSALPLATEVVRREPTDGLARYYLALVLLGMGDVEGSQEQARLAVEYGASSEHARAEFRELHKYITDVMQSSGNAER